MLHTSKKIPVLFFQIALLCGQIPVTTVLESDSAVTITTALNDIDEIKTDYDINNSLLLVRYATEEDIYDDRFNTDFSGKNIYRISYMPETKRKGTIKYYFKQLPNINFFHSDSTLVLSYAVQQQAAQQTATEAQSVIPDTIISVNFNAVNISDVFKTLSFRYGLNLLNNSTSSNTITMNAQGISLKNLFYSILESNSMTSVVVDNFIIISDTETLINSTIGLKTDIIHLNYISSQIAVESFADRLSERGLMKPLNLGQNSNKIIITDTPEKIALIKELVALIDVKPKQINIAVKFIETSLQSDERLGIDWTTRAQMSGPASVSDTSLTELGLGSWESFAMAKLDLPLYQIVIDALESDNYTKLLQEPQVTTFDNHEAKVDIGTTLPVLVPQGEGSVFGTNPYTFENVNVNISLTVVPTVSAENEIRMDISTQVSAIINFVGPDKDRPVVSTRSANTNVLIKDKETLLIGGLIIDDFSDSIGKVPFMGNIPLLKYFFTMKTKTDSQRELLIFITPSIIG